jgi:hypothetical protein
VLYEPAFARCRSPLELFKQTILKRSDHKHERRRSPRRPAVICNFCGPRARSLGTITSTRYSPGDVNPAKSRDAASPPMLAVTLAATGPPRKDLVRDEFRCVARSSQPDHVHAHQSSQYRKKGIFGADRIIMPHIWRIGPIKDQLKEKPE